MEKRKTKKLQDEKPGKIEVGKSETELGFESYAQKYMGNYYFCAQKIGKTF